MDIFNAVYFYRFVATKEFFTDFCFICLNGNKLCWGATCQG